ncbi:hypothetical protein DRQ05_01660 [bacterium]|nr:MAG: hypothetical protein DRQ05_01660 [bacterium]
MKRLIIALVLVSFVSLSVASMSVVTFGANVPLNQKGTTAVEQPISPVAGGVSGDDAANLQGLWHKIGKIIRTVAIFVANAVNYYLCNQYPEHWPQYFCHYF